MRPNKGAVVIVVVRAMKANWKSRARLRRSEVVDSATEDSDVTRTTSRASAYQRHLNRILPVD